MNGYRPIVELMNTNFGIYGMAELSSAGNTYATTGGQFKMPMTIIGAGGTAPNQALGAEHSQVHTTAVLSRWCCGCCRWCWCCFCGCVVLCAFVKGKVDPTPENNVRRIPD